MTVSLPRLLAQTLLPALILVTAPSVLAQQHGNNEKGPAYTEPPKDDASYSLMGEFVGKIKTEGKKRDVLALQIRPIKGDQFQAIAFFGGLPGEEGHQAEEMRLIGLRSGETVILSGGPWGIFVDSEGCNIVSSDGKMLGRLDRVHRVSPTLGAKPPENSVVVFDGSSVDNFVGAEMTDGGLLKEGALISPMFQDFDLHAEFRLPYMPLADGQQRGNSGMYLQSRYECQVLDSFGTEKMFNGLGALYRMKSPDFNMAFPPLVWQTYDISFTAPRWSSDGKKIRDAHITSWINGVKVQDDVALPSKTGAGKPEEPILLPINIQDHGDPVRFRNIWIVDRGLGHAKFPVIATKEQRAEAAKLEWNQPAQEQEAEAEPSEEAAAESAEPAESEEAESSEEASEKAAE
ncbi:DUF1080 domain-containing protein [Stieleria sp. JC731]|uniref:3-keto-disaccharide hydrolase n=1 Tax=Pirellulaceae TaxID=2691357 RepID=UPI001E4BED50|nr:DUF1080 domain-containing protein [Stieleria sp. JC731]MCC9600173.1 DUF1080 domain-containing protein [Stieleria sp. JC731]